MEKEQNIIRTIGLIGAGSVGTALISYLNRAYADNFYLLARNERALRLRKNGVSVNDCTMYPKVYAEESQEIKIDLLIISVKSYSLNAVIEDIRGLIQKETIILPLLNGIMATARLRAAFPENRVLYGVMLRTDAHRTGHKVYFTTSGEVQIGYEDNRVPAPEVTAIYECLKNAGVTVRIYEDMRQMQWRKWLSNTGGSLAAVEVGVECGYFTQVEEIVEIIRSSMDEILQLAKAEQVNLTEKDRDEMLDILLHYPAHKKMSMLQDVEAGRPLEIEEYAGTVVQLGRRHGIATPVNDILYKTIKAREKVDALRKHI